MHVNLSLFCKEAMNKHEHTQHLSIHKFFEKFSYVLTSVLILVAIFKYVRVFEMSKNVASKAPQSQLNVSHFKWRKLVEISTSGINTFLE